MGNAKTVDYSYTVRHLNERRGDGGLMLSTEAACLSSLSLAKLTKRSGRFVRKLVRDIAGLSTRTFCPVSFFGRPLLADVVTGSLYEVDSGQCLTGNLMIVGDAPQETPKRRGRGKSTQAQAATGWVNKRRREEESDLDTEDQT